MVGNQPFILRYVPISRLHNTVPPMDQLLILGEIYCVINSQTGERYVGQTSCAKMRNGNIVYAGYLERFEQHLQNAFSTNAQTRVGCPKLYEAIRAYGRHSFFVILLERCPLGDMNTREIEYIRRFRCRQRGYNVTKGGQFAKFGKKRRKRKSG